MAVGMNLLRAGVHVTVAGLANALHGRERQINNGTMRHRAIHHGPASNLVATLSAPRSEDTSVLRACQNRG